MYLILYTVLVFVKLAASTPLDPVRRGHCNANFDVCKPAGVESMTSPPIGSDMSSLYVDLLDSVTGIHFNRRSSDAEETDTFLVSHNGENKRSRSPLLCCAQGINCLLLGEYKIPFCYDKFTTNYIFPDGSYGSISTGYYNSADGSQANLITGEYTSNGQTGNIYSSDASAKPDLATLSIPPQWTAMGVGSAIPITALGKVAVYTTATVIPTTTLTPTITSSATVTRAMMVSDFDLSGPVLPATSIQDSTVQASTLPAPTVVEAKTTVITSTVLAVASTIHTGMGSALEVRASAISALFLVVACVFFTL